MPRHKRRWIISGFRCRPVVLEINHWRNRRHSPVRAASPRRHLCLPPENFASFQQGFQFRTWFFSQGNRNFRNFVFFFGRNYLKLWLFWMNLNKIWSNSKNSQKKTKKFGWDVSLLVGGKITEISNPAFQHGFGRQIPWVYPFSVPRPGIHGAQELYGSSSVRLFVAHSRVWPFMTALEEMLWLSRRQSSPPFAYGIQLLVSLYF